MMIRAIAIGSEIPDAVHTGGGKSDAENILFILLERCGCKNITTNEFYKQSSNAKPYLAVTFSCDSTDIVSTLSISLRSFKIHKKENQYLIYGDEGAVHFLLRHFLIQTLTSIQKDFREFACEKIQPSNLKFLYNMIVKKEAFQWEGPPMKTGCLSEYLFNHEDVTVDTWLNFRNRLFSIGLTLQDNVQISKASYITQDKCGILEDKEDKNERPHTSSLFWVNDTRLFVKKAILPSILKIQKYIYFFLGLHQRCGKRSSLFQAQMRSSIFDPQAFRVAFKLVSVSLPTKSPPKYNAASSRDDKEIKESIELVYKDMIHSEEKRLATQSKNGARQANITEDNNNYVLSAEEAGLAGWYKISMIPDRGERGGLPLTVHQTFHNNTRLQLVLRILRHHVNSYCTPANFYKLCNNVKLRNALYISWIVSNEYVTSANFDKLCQHEKLVEALAAAYDYWESANFNNYSTPSCFSLHGRHGKNVTIAFVHNLMKMAIRTNDVYRLSSLIDACTKEWHRTSNPDKKGSRARYAKLHSLFKDDNHQKLGLVGTITSLRHGFSSIPSTRR